MSSYIRYANIKDSDVLGDIHSKSLTTSFKDIIPDEFLFENFSFERRRNGLYNELSQGTPKTAIMYLDKKPVAMITFGNSRYSENEESLIEIWRIYILPLFWRQGIGTELMNWGINEIRSKGYKKVELWVLEDNKQARNFYEKFGFRIDGTVRVINVGKELNELRYIINI